MVSNDSKGESYVTMKKLRAHYEYSAEFGSAGFWCRALAVVLMFVLFATFSACTLQETGTPVSNTEFSNSTTAEPTFIAPEPIPEQRALISFAGDCIFSSRQDLYDFNNAYDREGPAYFLSGVSDVFANDDLTVVNLESVLTTSDARADKGEPEDEDGKLLAYWFKAPPEYVNILTAGSVEMCNLATNHILDYGWEGYEETKRVLSDAGVDYFIWEQTIVKDVNGIKIGFFGFSFDSNADNIRRAMDQLWADGAEVIVAYFHDGTELAPYPSEDQKTAAYAAIDYGASAVLMSHVHRIQGVETYKETFIAWSMGNFCVGQYGGFDDADSMIVQLEFVRTNGAITCTPTIIPCSNSSILPENDYRPIVLTGDEATRVLERIEELSK